MQDIQTEASSVLDRIESIRQVVTSILADPPRTKLEFKRRIVRELGIDPTPDALHAMTQIPEIPEAGARDLAARSMVAHLATEIALGVFWNNPETDPDAVRDAAASLPGIIDLRADHERAFSTDIESVSRLEKDAVQRIHEALRLPDEPIRAALTVAPEIERLATAARSGTLTDAAPNLTPDETEAIRSAAVAGLDPTSRPDRVLVDAITLKALIERDLATWRAAEAPATEARTTLEAERAACQFVSARLDAVRSKRFHETKTPNRALDEARRKLFGTYVALNQALAGEPAGPAAEVHEQIREAEREGAAVDQRRQTTETLMRDAAAREQNAVRPQTIVETSARDLAREQRRKKVLIGTAIALVPVAVLANVLFYPRARHRSGFDPEAFGQVLPLREAVPIPGQVYSEVSSTLWDAMSRNDRTAKVDEMGRLARQQGFDGVLVVDESRRELARWSAAGGVALVETPATP